MNRALALLCWTISGSLAASAAATAQSLVTIDDVVASGLDRPVQLTAPHDGSGRLFVVEQAGRVRILNAGAPLPTPFLDIRSLVASSGEQGLLGLAFHPRYAENGLFYVDYTDLSGDTVVARYAVSADPDVADPTSATVVLRVDQPFANHNGGQLHFGPFDGYLYVGLGDGGSANDPLGHGQNPTTLLGTILRLDVDGATPYAIPPDNPFVNAPGADEIWAYGLRNPWRFGFDRETGDLYIGDVGQSTWEEIDVLPGGTTGGVNFGWAIREGPCPRGQTLPCSAAPAGLTDPIAFYGRTEGRSVTGGFVYRGLDHPSLVGRYVYADFITGRLWSIETTGPGPETFSAPILELATGLAVSGFGEDENAELYLVDYGGTIRRVGALDPPVVTDPPPGSRLASSQTFQWDPRETPVSEWRLTAGAAAGGTDYFDSGPLTATTVLVTGLPTDGGDVSVRLSFLARGSWRHADFDYLAAELRKPELRWPAPGSTLRSRWALLLWTAGPEGVTGWRLTVGSSAGTADVYDSGPLAPWRRWTFATGLPTDGRTLHVRLAYDAEGETLSVDTTYEAATR